MTPTPTPPTLTLRPRSSGTNSRNSNFGHNTSPGARILINEGVMRPGASQQVRIVPPTTNRASLYAQVHQSSRPNSLTPSVQQSETSRPKSTDSLENRRQIAASANVARAYLERTSSNESFTGKQPPASPPKLRSPSVPASASDKRRPSLQKVGSPGASTPSPFKEPTAHTALTSHPVPPPKIKPGTDILPRKPVPTDKSQAIKAGSARSMQGNSHPVLPPKIKPGTDILPSKPVPTDKIQASKAEPARRKQGTITSEPHLYREGGKRVDGEIAVSQSVPESKEEEIQYAPVFIMYGGEDMPKDCCKPFPSFPDVVVEFSTKWSVKYQRHYAKDIKKISK